MSEQGQEQKQGQGQGEEQEQDGQEQDHGRRRAGGAGGEAKRGRRWLVTERDREWLGWLGRWRFATAAQLSEHFEAAGSSAPVRVVERRMRAFRELGLVESERVLYEVPSVHWLTAEGLRFVGLSGSVFRPKLAQFRHDLAEPDLAAWWLASRPGWSVVSERELRRGRSSPLGESWEVSLPEKSEARAWKVYPDLVAVSPSGSAVTLELEFSRKEHARLVRLMLAYGLSPSVSSSVYFATPDVKRHVEAAATVANRIIDERGEPGRRIRVVAWPPPPASSKGTSSPDEHPTAGAGGGV